MVKNHLSRLSAPKSWPIARKGSKFVLKTSPGASSIAKSVSITLILREMLGLAKTAKEAKAIINSGKLLINKKVKKDPAHGVGLMDVVEIDEIKGYYRMLLDYKGKFMLHPIPKAETGLRPCKIRSKKLIKAGKIQLSLHDGSNIIVDNKDYKPGDTLLLSDGKVKEHFKMEKGATVFITGGNKVSSVGTMEKVKSFKGCQDDDIVVKSKKALFETRKKYAFVIGKDKPSISLPKNE